MGLYYLVIITFTSFLTAAKSVNAGKVELLNSKKLMTLKWQMHSSSGTRGWREGTYMDGTEGLRVYVVCDALGSGSQPVKNWLALPYLETNMPTRVYIELSFTMRKCPDNSVICKERFKLYVNESDTDVKDILSQSWKESNYKFVDNIMAQNVFTDASNPPVNTEIRSVGTSHKGVTLTLVDDGACMTLLKVRVYYIQCDSTVANMARFSATPAGPQITSLVEVMGECLKNAGAKPGETPKYICKSNGAWVYLMGRCTCLPGHQAAFNNPGTCSPCDKGQFKDTMGNHLCEYCPYNSQSDRTGAAICPCKENYYRAENDAADYPCTVPPSPVRDVYVVTVDERSAVLAWSMPTENSRPELHYRMTCDICGIRVEYNPSQYGLMQNSVRVDKLRPGTAYIFTVYAENDVSHQSPKDNGVSIELITKQGLPSISNVLITHVFPTEIRLQWEVEEHAYERVKFKITYCTMQALSADCPGYMETDREAIAITNLQPDTGYTINVAVETEGGTGPSFQVQVYTAATTVKVTELTTTPATTTRPAITQILLTFPPKEEDPKPTEKAPPEHVEIYVRDTTSTTSTSNIDVVNHSNSTVEPEAVIFDGRNHAARLITTLQGVTIATCLMLYCFILH